MRIFFITVFFCSIIFFAGAFDCDTENTTVGMQTGMAYVFNFDQNSSGTVPFGWRTASNNDNDHVEAVWEVTADQNAPSSPNVLAITDLTREAGEFNLCWNDSVSFSDGWVSVQVRADSGSNDQGGGPIWRVQDDNNYYVARCNPLEDNIRLYRVVDQVRTQIGTADVSADSGQWFTIRVQHVGNNITVFLDGEQKIVATDSTFSSAGGIGVWSKEDAKSSFDDLSLSVYE